MSPLTLHLLWPFGCHEATANTPTDSLEPMLHARCAAMLCLQRYFGFIEATADDARELISGLGEECIETKTRGTQYQPGARAVGEGSYSIVDHGGRHTHLLYSLTSPAEPGDVQVWGVCGVGARVWVSAFACFACS